MGYSPALGTRSTLIYGYGASVTTIGSPNFGQPYQPIDTMIHSGAVDASGSGVTFVSDTLQGRTYSNAINPSAKSVIHLDMVMDINRSGSVNYNDYATYYALTSAYDYLQDVRQFEVTSTFYEGGNTSLLTVTDGATFTLLESGERMGYFFHAAASTSNDMVVPYSRLYGWSGIE